MNTNITAEQKEQIKRSCWERIFVAPLMQGCRGNDETYLRALFIGYWHFVDSFPAVIRETYEDSARFTRYGKVLSGALREMESDERNHRALWIKSANAVSIDADELYNTAPLQAVTNITTLMLARDSLWQRLLDFVAVEIVAEGISAYLIPSEKLISRMGKEGMGWFRIHAIHPENQTSHENIAYRAAESMMQPGEATFSLISRTIQETVDRFIVASNACVDAYCR